MYEGNALEGDSSLVFLPVGELMRVLVDLVAIHGTKVRPKVRPRLEISWRRLHEIENDPKGSA